MALSEAQQKAIVAAAAKRYGIKPEFLWGVYGTESDFGHNQGPSSTGATGNFQFEPATRAAYGNPQVGNFQQEAYAAAALLGSAKAGGEMGMVARYYGEPSSSYLASVRKYGATFNGGSGGGILGGLESAAGTIAGGAETAAGAIGAGLSAGAGAVGSAAEAIAGAPGAAIGDVGKSVAGAIAHPLEEAGLYVALVAAGLALIWVGITTAVRPGPSKISLPIPGSGGSSAAQGDAALAAAPSDAEALAAAA
jgi:hypothetical protein